MLQLQCTCGWAAVGETKQALFEQAKAHLACCPDRAESPLDEEVLRAVIAQRARRLDA